MIFCLCLSVDCNVAASKSQTWTKDWFFLSVIIECNMKFTSSVEKISYKWALYGCKTLKTSQRFRNVQVSLDLSVIPDSVEEQTDFSCFLSTVVLPNRPRSHWGRFWKLDRSEIGLGRNFFLFEMDHRDPRSSQRPRSLIDEAEGEIWSNPIVACQECDRRWKSARSKKILDFRRVKQRIW